MRYVLTFPPSVELSRAEADDFAARFDAALTDADKRAVVLAGGVTITELPRPDTAHQVWLRHQIGWRVR
jgi:hypothetical protein